MPLLGALLIGNTVLLLPRCGGHAVGAFALSFLLTSGSIGAANLMWHDCPLTLLSRWLRNKEHPGWHPRYHWHYYFGSGLFIGALAVAVASTLLAGVYLRVLVH